MPWDVFWEDYNKSLLTISARGDWTWEELDATMAYTYTRIIDPRPYTVDLILNLDGIKFGPGLFRRFRQYVRISPPNRGLIVLIAPSEEIAEVIGTTADLFGQASKFRLVADMEAAKAIVYWERAKNTQSQDPAR